MQENKKKTNQREFITFFLSITHQPFHPIMIFHCQLSFSIFAIKQSINKRFARVKQK